MSIFSGIAKIILTISIISNYIVWEKSVLFLIKANFYFARALDRRPRPHIDDYGIFQINVILIFDERGRGRGRGAAVDGLGCGRQAQARATVDGWRAQVRATGAGRGRRAGAGEV